MHMTRWWTVMGMASMTIACASTATESSPTSQPDASPATSSPRHAVDTTSTSTADHETPWHPLVREIAAQHATWGLVDNQFHWAPGLCAMPARGVQHLSVADAGTPHAEKVFVLQALDPRAYWTSAGETGVLPQTLERTGAPITSRDDVVQVLVKDSFVPRPLEGGPVSMQLRPARKGDVSYGAGDPIGLFVMAQLRGTPEGTDAGWIYATIAPDGTITAAGDLEACRGCHAQQADRVFGMPLHWK